MTSPDPFSKSSLFEQAVRAILRPLVRALISQGVTAPAFYRIVKQTYVDVAVADNDGVATDSKVSVMTGVHRRDVKAIRETDQTDTSAVAQKASTLATVVGRWLSNPLMTDAAGNPLPLPRQATGGPSFEALVQGISRDIRARTILDELVRQAVVTEKDDIVTLSPSALIGPADMDQKLHFFSHNVGDHMSASVENLLAEHSPFLERAVFYNNLSEGSVAEIEQAALAKGRQVLQDINAQAAALQTSDHDTPGATHRFRFGVFFFKQDEAEAAQDDTTKRDSP